MQRLAAHPQHRPPALAGQALAEDLAVVVGADSARAMMAEFAGGTIYVPRHAGPNHPLAVVLGMEKAQRICDYYHATRLEFPLSASKRRRALDLKAAGLSNRAIARELWMTERHVRRILAAARAQGTEQLALFG